MPRVENAHVVSVDIGNSEPLLDGWTASPNPFDALRMDAPASGAPEGFAANIARTVDTAIASAQAGRWRIATDHLRSAIWTAVAFNDIAACLLNSQLLMRCQLATSDFQAARRNALQMLPLGLDLEDRALTHALCTTICLCDCFVDAPDAAASLQTWVGRIDTSLSRLLKDGVFSQWLQRDVAELIGLRNAEYAQNWTRNWLALQRRHVHAPHTLPLLQALIRG
jgi:hypothetical protein